MQGNLAERLDGDGERADALDAGDIARRAGELATEIADLSGIVLMRQVDGKRMAAAYDLRQLRKGTMEDPQIYGDDIIVVEESGSKTAMRRFLESMPVLGIFSWL